MECWRLTSRRGNAALRAAAAVTSLVPAWLMNESPYTLYMPLILFHPRHPSQPQGEFRTESLTRTKAFRISERIK